MATLWAATVEVLVIRQKPSPLSFSSGYRLPASIQVKKRKTSHPDKNDTKRNMIYTNIGELHFKTLVNMSYYIALFSVPFSSRAGAEKNSITFKNLPY